MPYFTSYGNRTWVSTDVQINSNLGSESSLPRSGLVLGREEDIERAASKLGYVSAEGVRQINSSLRQPEYKTILREAYAGGAGGCSEMIPHEKGGWIGIGWFKDQPSYEACLKYCEREKVTAQNCPCATLFKGK